MFNYKKLKPLREKQGTLVDVAFKMKSKGFDVSPQSLHQWETGDHPPNVSNLAILAAFFKKPMEYFFK